MDGHKHYIRTDANGVVIHRFSDAFETPLDTDICVATGAERHYNSRYTNERGQLIYTWDGSGQVLRSQTKLDAEWAARPAPVDPDKDLSDAISAATTFEDLKAALLGNSGKLARVRGRVK